jgi:hypothetical protein
MDLTDAPFASRVFSEQVSRDVDFDGGQKENKDQVSRGLAKNWSWVKSVLLILGFI